MHINAVGIKCLVIDIAMDKNRDAEKRKSNQKRKNTKYTNGKAKNKAKKWTEKQESKRPEKQAKERSNIVGKRDPKNQTHKKNN